MSRITIDLGFAPRRLGSRAVALLATLLAVAISAGSAALAADIDNKGTEFLMMFLRNTSGGPRADQVQLALTADTATSVTIEYPVGTPLPASPVIVNPGAITTVTLPVAASTGWILTGAQSNLVRATAPDEFVAYMINRRGASSDAALALPVDTMNTTYIVQTYSPRFVGSQFGVYSAIDGTTVTITPSNAIVGHAAGVPFDIVLNAGQGFHAQSTSLDATLGDLSGTSITATRPVGVVNGNGCTQVPSGVTACDHIFEVAQPVQTWGTTIPVANLPLRTEGSIYRILASEDGTAVNLDGALIATLDRGKFAEVPVQINGSGLPGGHLFVGSAPIFVTQFMPGIGFFGSTSGDPAMGNMIPAEQYLTAYTFSTVGGGQFARDFLTVIADDRDLATITLDGAPIGAGAFTSIPGSGFSWARIELLVEGTHTTASANSHGITVEGYDSADSYLYPGGALFNPINVSDENPPLCGGGVVAGIFSGFADDDRPTEDTNGNLQLDPGEDLNGNGMIDIDTGIFDVSLAPGSSNVALTATFSAGDPNVTFTVATIGGNVGFGTVIARDGAGNECSVPVALGPPDVDPPLCDIFYDSNTGSFSGSASDSGTGIATIGLSGHENLSLSAVFTPGAVDVPFTVSVDNPNVPAVGTVTVTDGQGFTCQLNIDLPVVHPYVDQPGWGEGVALQKIGNSLFAYVAAGEAGVHIYNVTNPGAPLFLRTEVPDPGSCAPISGFPDFYADAVTIVQGGDLPFANAVFDTDIAVFAAGACGVIGADISNPNDLVTAFVFDTPSWAEAVDVLIDPVNETVYLYVASFWGGLRIFGQTDPQGDPEAFGELGTFGVNDPVFFGPAIDLRAEFRNNMILVHVLTDRGLRTIDVTDPANPVQIGSFEFDVALNESGEGMTIVGDRAFVALWKGGLLTLDITDPTNPTEVGTVPTNLAIYSVTTNAAGTRLYAAEGMFGLRTFWINPGSLAEHIPSQIDVGDGAWAWSLTERDRLLYVTYGHLTEPLTGGLQIFEFTEDIACGLGFELVFLLPPIMWLRARRLRARRA
jgi:hypothetical protein